MVSRVKVILKWQGHDIYLIIYFIPLKKSLALLEIVVVFFFCMDSNVSGCDYLHILLEKIVQCASFFFFNLFFKCLLG